MFRTALLTLSLFAICCSSVLEAQSPVLGFPGKPLRPSANDKRVAEMADAPVAEIMTRAGALARRGKRTQALALLHMSCKKEPVASALFYAFDPAAENVRKKLEASVFEYTTAYMHWKHPDDVNNNRAPLELRRNHSEYVHFYRQLGNNLFWLGDYERALTCYERELTKSKHPKTKLRAGLCAALLRYDDIARGHIDAAFAPMPAAALAYVRLHGDMAVGFESQLYLQVIQENINRHFPDMDGELIALLDDIWDGFRMHRQEPPPFELHPASVVEGSYDCYPQIFHPGLKAVREQRTARTFERLDSLFTRHGIPAREAAIDRFHLPVAMLRDAPLWFMDKHWDAMFAVYGNQDDYYNLHQDLIAAYDGALIRAGRKQRYGTAVIYDENIRAREGIDFYPTEDPFHVAERRAAVGLKPHDETYAKEWYVYNAKKQAAHQGTPEGIYPYPGALKAYRLNEWVSLPYDEYGMGRRVREAEEKKADRKGPGE